MDRRLISTTIFACTALIGLAGCESNGGIRVAGVGDYALGLGEGQEEFSEGFTSDSFADGAGTGQITPTQVSSFSDFSSGQTLLARAGNSPINMPGTDVIRVASIPANAAVLLRPALAEGQVPGRMLANLIRPAGGIVNAGAAPVVGAITDVAAGAVAPLAPVTAPIVTAATEVVAGATNVAGGATNVVGGVTGVAGGALASVGETVNASVGQVVNNVTAPVVAGVAGSVAGPVAGTIDIAGNVAGGAAAAVGGTVAAVPGTVVAVVQDVAAAVPLTPAVSPVASAVPNVVQTVQTVPPAVTDALAPVAGAAAGPVSGVVGGLLRATR